MTTRNGCRRRLVGGPLAAWAILIASAAGLRAQDCAPVISEFLASNRAGLTDEDGDTSDWIEIHNPCDRALSLEGWSLTDDADAPRKWVFPDRDIAPGERLVVFASGKDRAGSELHASFELDVSGEYLGLIAPDGVTVASDFAPIYPRQAPDVSFGVGVGVTATLVELGAEARWRVPVAADDGGAWRLPAHDDSGWERGPSGVGWSLGDGAGLRAVAPIAYWPLDGSRLDAAGSADLDLRGGRFDADAPDATVTRESLLLDGGGEYASAALDVPEVDYSLSLWFRTSRSDVGLFAVVAGELGSGGHDRHLYLAGGNIAARVWDNETISSQGKSYGDGQWHHVCHVVGPAVGGQRIWVDGEVVAAGAKDASDFDWQGEIHVGFSNDAAQDFLSGHIADVSVWDVALLPDEVASLARGASPFALVGVGGLVESDVSELLHGSGTSLLLRFPFDLAAPVVADAIELRAAWDDGFVAWIDGVRVASRSAPEPLRYDAAATEDRPIGAAVRFESLPLGVLDGRLDAGAHVLAIQLLNDTPGSDHFLFAGELAAVRRDAARWLDPPTPGSESRGAFDGLVGDTSFSVDRGLFDAPIEVDVTTFTPDAEIWYTTDGTVPAPGAAGSSLAEGPIAISTTTTLRARAFRDGWVPSNTDTQTYIFPAQVVEQTARPSGLPTTWSGGFPADYGMDPDVSRQELEGYEVERALVSLPTISIVAEPEDLFAAGTGIYHHSERRGEANERAASMEWIWPDGEQGWQIDCGIRMHGNSSRNHSFTPKHPIRLLFRGKWGPQKLERRVFEDSHIDSFDQLLLRGCSTDSWPVTPGGPVLGVIRWHPDHGTYMRDQWMRNAQIALGQRSGFGTYVQLYLNGMYWGLYNLAERPVSSIHAEHLGGHKSEWDILKDFAELQDGSRAAWDQLIQMAQQGLSSNAAYQRVQGRRPDGTRDPSLPVLLDVQNLIDYMILHIASGAEDWPDHNWWVARRRGDWSEGFKFFVWDQEISNDSLVRTHTRIQTRFEDPISSPSPSLIYGRLRGNPDFNLRFSDRVHELLSDGGRLSPAANAERWEHLQEWIDVAIVGESARWGDSKRSVPYRRETDWLDEMRFMAERYWPDVRPIAFERFRRAGYYPDVEAPRFTVDGRASTGERVGAGAQIGLEVVTTELRWVDVPIVGPEASVTAWVPEDGRLSGDWVTPGFVEGAAGEAWESGVYAVGFEGGSGYEDLIGIDTSDRMSGEGRNSTVYVRVRFDVEERADITSLERLELRVLYDDGFAAWINGRLVASANAPETLAWNSTSAGSNEANPAAPEVFDLTEHLSALRVGSNVLALQGMNFNELSSDMIIQAELVGGRLDDEPAPGTVFYTLDGETDPMDPEALSFTAPFTIDRNTIVRARARDGAEWSALVEAVFRTEAPSGLRVTELHYNPSRLLAPSSVDTDLYEFIELGNVGSDVVVLDGYRITGAVEFDFFHSDIDVIRPGERVLLVRSLEHFAERHDHLAAPIAGRYDGKLSNGGERFVLLGPGDEEVQDFEWDDAWHPLTDGGGLSLVVRDPRGPLELWSRPEGWRPSDEIDGTPGVADATDGGGAGLVRTGDANGDGSADLSDAIRILLELFGGGAGDLPCDGDAIDAGGNLAVHDVNGDARVDLTDAVSLLLYLFQSGEAPAGGPGCRFVEGCDDLCAF